MLSTMKLLNLNQWSSLSRRFLGSSAQSKLFPLLTDKLDLNCPQYNTALKVTEKQVHQLKKLTAVALGGGKHLLLFYFGT